MGTPGGDSMNASCAQQSALAHQQHPTQHLNSREMRITS